MTTRSECVLLCSVAKIRVSRSEESSAEGAAFTLLHEGDTHVSDALERSSTASNTSRFPSCCFNAANTERAICIQTPTTKLLSAANSSLIWLLDFPKHITQTVLKLFFTINFIQLCT